MKNEQTNKPSQCCLRVSILGIFYWGINTIKKKEMGKGPGEGGSGRVASGLSASSRLDMNQSESVTGHQAKLY